LDENSTLTDVAFIVCTALERAGEHAVLCGGSRCTIAGAAIASSTYCAARCRSVTALLQSRRSCRGSDSAHTEQAAVLVKALAIPSQGAETLSAKFIEPAS